MNDKKYSSVEVNEFITNAVQSALAANSVDQGMRQRIAQAISGGYDWSDTLHNIYLDYGYPFTLDFFKYWNMYRRFGVARRVVELYPDQTWSDDPIVVGNDGAFNRDLKKLNETLGLWRRLKGLDTRQRVGRYAGLFMRVRDGKKPNEAIDGKLSGLAALVDMIPLYESQLEVSTIQDDPQEDDFGMPTMYQFNGGTVGDRNEKSGASFQIHPSRIIIASEDSDNSGIYGISALESVYNSLMDLRKILGAGGEGFYKNAAQSIVMNLKDPEKATSVTVKKLEKFNDEVDDFMRDRMRRSLWTLGMETDALQSNLVNPKDFAMNSLYDISAGSNIPVALLIGNQTGRLAGDQDTEGFLSQVQSRRLDFGTDIVKAAVNWMIKWGVLPSSTYETEWPDAMAPSDEKKLGNAESMSTINKTQFESGGNVPFTGEEIREAAGFEPVVDPDDVDVPDETLEGGEDE